MKGGKEDSKRLYKEERRDKNKEGNDPEV